MLKQRFCSYAWTDGWQLKMLGVSISSLVFSHLMAWQQESAADRVYMWNLSVYFQFCQYNSDNVNQAVVF